MIHHCSRSTRPSSLIWPPKSRPAAWSKIASALGAAQNSPLAGPFAQAEQLLIDRLVTARGRLGREVGSSLAACSGGVRILGKVERLEEGPRETLLAVVEQAA